MLLRSRVTLFLVPAFSAALSGRPARRVAAAPWRYAGREARAEFTLDGDTPYQYSSLARTMHTSRPYSNAWPWA